MDQGMPFLLTLEYPGGSELLKVATKVQAAARKLGFKTTWLLGAAALAHPEDLVLFAEWQQQGGAEIGLLVDAQTVPPLVDLGSVVEGRRPFLTDFPDSVMDEKVAWLTQTLERATGKRPTSIRAVPPSVDDRYYSLLTKWGFKADLTVVPHARFGPSDFTGYSEKAYFTPQGILEIPRSVRKRKHGPLVEDLCKLPGPLGRLFQFFFPSLRCLRLRQGNRRQVKWLLRDSIRQLPDHLDLRIALSDWGQGERLVRNLERALAMVRGKVVSVRPEEYQQRLKTEQLRKGLV